MKTLNKRFHDYMKNKSAWGKITDILFILLIVALIIPGSRLAIGGYVNRLKAMIMQPSIIDKNDMETVSEQDYDWVLIRPNGNRVNLADYKGRVIFLNFWATWCPPCVGEMPGIQKLYDTYKTNSDVAFLLVSNEQPEAVQKFMDKKEYSIPVFTAINQVPRIFYSKTIPATYVISKSGKIAVKENGAVNWGGEKMASIINDLLNEKNVRQNL